MKKCSKCGHELTINNWYSSYIKRNKYTCILCLKKARPDLKTYNKKQHLKAKQRIKDLKINGCAICGYDKCDRALHFHHINPKDKKFCINADSVRKRKLNDLINEIYKCILLCANCHNEKHAELERGRE